MIKIPKSISRFLSESIIYVLVNILNKAIPFILLPIIVRMVSTDDFGKYSLFLTIEVMLIPVITLNLPAALSRHYYVKDLDLKSYISTIFWGMLVIALPFFGVLLLVPAEWISQLSIEKKYLELAFFVSFVGAFIAMILNLFRLQRKPLQYGAYIIFQSLFLLLTVIVFLKFEASFHKIVEAKVCVMAVLMILSLGLLKKKNLIAFQFDKEWFTKAFRFSLPTMLYSLTAVVFVSSDRFLIEKFLSIEALGYYAAIYQLGSIMSLLGMSVNAAWMPWLFENLEKKNAQIDLMVVKFSYALIGLFLLLGIVFALLFPFLSKLVLPENFYEYIPVVYPIIGGFVFEAIYLIVSPYLYYVEKTQYNFYIGAVVAIVNVVMNFLLIPVYGIVAASYAMFVSWLLLAFLFFIFSYINYKMPWFYFLKISKDDR